MNEWIQELCDLTGDGEPVVVVTVAGIRGSAPREIGAKMIVTGGETIGTIGGGQLEYQCTRIACGLLGQDRRATIETIALGASMGQCCGGVVEVLFEPLAAGLPAWLRDLRALHGLRRAAVLCTEIGTGGEKLLVTEDSGPAGLPGDSRAPAVDVARTMLLRNQTARRDGAWFLEPIVGTDFNIAVFGAGHVGAAVIRTLAALDCNIRWVDGRRNIFREVPGNVRAIECEEPALEVAAMPAGSSYLVMTHSHPLDYAICERILERGDALYCGLIGSQAKRRRFEKRFRAQGISESRIRSLVCPIGIDGINGKKPAEIAIAAVAELLRARDRRRCAATDPYPDNVRPLQG